MGWWPFGGSASTEPSPPTREERQKCWESRDAYFVCLDRAGVVKPGTEGKACSAENRLYEKTCAQSWVCMQWHLLVINKLLIFCR
ncbi:cytochrome oxidase c subunit VIb-domain-containing protein [Favolaschia claudopus]|uniref:Cytochrome oxidase c subunit VIb-domain-containing protein n=1 Tax=Favolaschia claudopus TaxID=2862362 RepID=A0AAW0AVV6_9AGAR